MKVSIKLLTNYKETKQGFPVYLIIRSGKNRKMRRIAFSKTNQWNKEINLPLNNHPNYLDLSKKIIDYNYKISKLNFNKLNFNQAQNYIFSDNIISLEFYKNCLKFCDNTNTGKLNKTILNSFNTYNPNILINDISPKIVEKYKNTLLKLNTSNGVHTYLRKLSTLYTRISENPNPFKGIRPKKKATKSKALNLNDIKKIINTRSIKKINDTKNNNETINYPRYYWLLMFYLGGIDFIDLANLRYDLHVYDNRIQFNRFKGQTDVYINNKIFPEALEILKKFNCKPYLIPAFKNKDYKSFVDRANTNLYHRTKDLNLTKKPLTKSARYTFITRAQQLLIDERITVEIVGHTQQKIHSIYTDEFPLKIRDKAHKKIITIN
tara:strand:+ start:1148 stop:2284 length:1137 start_codon:yes stop_codon:yes gene_type:complete